MADALSPYRQKRDFTQTAEPSGADAVLPAERLRFVIQKHDATRLHYDFRLEHEGVFKSWAITRGPSLDPADKRLAVEVEDHPLDYGDFEGVIPKGQYGGGVVMLWDRGFWAPEPGTTVEQGLAKGDLKLVLEGEKLHGGWVLVRMAHDRAARGGKPGRTNWLLIKHRDGTEEPGDGDRLLQSADRSVASGRDLPEIASGAAPGPTRFMTGVGQAPARRVWNSNRGDPEASAEAVAEEPPSRPEPARPAPRAKPPRSSTARRATAEAAPAPPAFIAPALASSVDRPPAGAGWAHEIKFDGYRLQLRVAGGRATVKTRSGLDWSERFPEIVADGARLPDAILDGEAVALDTHGAPDFAGLQAALSDSRTDGLLFFAFDLLYADGEDWRARPLSERKSRLEALLEGAPAGGRLRFVAHFEAAGEAVLRSACSMQLEGVVSKRLSTPYRSGRSDDWLKSKCRGGQEVIVAGWTSGEGKPFRSLLAAVRRENRLVYVGRVGTGFGAKVAGDLLPRLRKVASPVSPFAPEDTPKAGAEVHWARPVLVAEIESAGWTGAGALRQASFKGLREDKAADDVVQETPAPIEAVASSSSATPVQTAAAARRAPMVMGVTLSHPEKALWPAESDAAPVSKLDLAVYYEAVAAAIMPHLTGRPCSIIRQPDGIGGQSFFQRHAGAGSSSLLTLVEVRGDKKPYVQVDRPEALAAVAQSGGVELHPWNCAPGRPEVAGRLVFDLDPAPDVAFETVIAAAKEVRARLEALGLVAFCKTTGGKGLHVVTPLDVSGDRAIEWPQAKAFARGVCEAIAADAPDRFLVNMSKAKRTGRIFLDYLRNDRLSTAVAPYSPRGRPGAPVSWPVSWTQVKRGLDPLAYTIRTAPGLLKRNKAWAGYDEAARPLGEAIARLATRG